MCIACDPSQIDSNIILLDCSGCQMITSLPESLPNLKFLVIYDTNISSIPEYESLEGLYCMRCPIERLPNMPKLRKLNASESNILEIPNTLHRVETIMVDHTNIESIPDTLISVRQISASHTKITSISSKLINLESLSINNTQVDSIDPLMSLQYINFSNTSITDLPLNNLQSLRKVVAKGCSLDNPFSIIERGIDLTN